MSKEKGYIEKSVRQYIEKKFYSIGLFTGLPAMYIAIDSLGNSKSSSALQILEKKIKFMTYKLISFIEEHNFTEFNSLVRYARKEDIVLLNLIVNKTYFFAKYLDSRRHSNNKERKYNER